MLTWSQADRVVGFRNDYRNYAGMFSATVTLAAAGRGQTAHRRTLSGERQDLRSSGLPEAPERQRHAGAEGRQNRLEVSWRGQYRLDALDLALGGKSVVSALVGVAIKEEKFTRSTI
jgi:hypothetical protein